MSSFLPTRQDAAQAAATTSQYVNQDVLLAEVIPTRPLMMPTCGRDAEIPIGLHEIGIIGQELNLFVHIEPVSWQ